MLWAATAMPAAAALGRPLCCDLLDCIVLAQIEKWEAQREAGTYPGPVPGEKKGGGG